MDWPVVLLIILGSLAVLMATGLPVAFSFLLVNLVGVFLLWGGLSGLGHVTLSLANSVTKFSLLAIPMFILMGEIMFHSHVAPVMIDAIDKWMGRLPGRLGLLGVGAGTLFATMTGTSMGSVAMLGTVLVPEMEKHGYKKSMSLGPILGSGGLAVMIPPSSTAVLLGAIGEISIGKILIAIIVPGLMLAALYAVYIIGRCSLQPEIAPSYNVVLPPFSQRLKAGARYVLPLSLVIFLVVGVIFLGIATPSEAAATGVIGTFLLTIIYGKLSWAVVRKSLLGTLSITVMIFMIIVGATAFSQILAISGATRGLIELVGGLPVHPIIILVLMQVILLFLGTFLEVVSIMMITVPLFMPIVAALNFNTVWFAALFLLNMEMAAITPPFGLSLFTMKAVAPSGTTMEDIYKAALPFIACGLIVLGLIIAFPQIALWLPGIMRN